MESSTFSHKGLDHLKITFLQVLIIMLEIDGAPKIFLESHEVIGSFVAENLHAIYEGKCTTIRKNETLKDVVEEFLILVMIQKLLQREQSFVPTLILSR
jgi:hypothetical protein